MLVRIVVLSSHNQFLPPCTRCACYAAVQIIIVVDSDDDDEEEEEVKMLPPIRLTLSAHKAREKGKRGAKQKKRFRSSGAVNDKGGARKRNRNGAASGRTGGRHDGAAAQQAIACMDLDGLCT